MANPKKLSSISVNGSSCQTAYYAVKKVNSGFYRKSFSSCGHNPPGFRIHSLIQCLVRSASGQSLLVRRVSF